MQALPSIARDYGRIAIQSSAVLGACLIAVALIVSSVGIAIALVLTVLMTLGGDPPMMGFMGGIVILLSVVIATAVLFGVVWLLAASVNAGLVLPAMLAIDVLSRSIAAPSARTRVAATVAAGSGAALIATCLFAGMAGLLTGEPVWMAASALLALVFSMAAVIVDAILLRRSLSCYASSLPANPTAPH
jgi:hypothetical protein